MAQNMTDSTRQILLKALDLAFASALPRLQDHLDSLPPEAQAQTTQSAEGIRICLSKMAEAPAPTQESQETLVRLIFAHSDARVVRALKEFTEVVNFYLQEARDNARPPRSRKDS